jgi:ribosome biogenesis GTPase
MAETLAIKPILIFNKSDLLAQHPNWLAIFQLYQQLGYAWVFNTTDGPPSAALIKLLKQQSTLLVGQSGVGKSSLIRQLIPNIEVQIGAINQNTHLGRHTTTVTRLYYLPNGGYLIDSPGIRQFDVNHLNATQIAYGFKEFRPFLGQCKFRNCLHEQDLGCALLAALNQGNISSRRYAIFKTLVQQSREFRLV